MKNDLLAEVQAGINSRKGEWHKMASAIPGVSYSWISQIGRGAYKSAPSYSRLKAVAAYLKSTKPKAA